MGNSSPEIGLPQMSIPESRSEIRLSPQKVQEVYRAAKSGNMENGNYVDVHDLVNDEIFNKEAIEKNRGTIEKLAYQLQPRFFKKDVGNDWHDAIYDQYQTQWAQSEEDSKHLLALISAIRLGRFTTSREYLRNCPTKEKNVFRYLIDPERYQKIQGNKLDISIIK